MTTFLFWNINRKNLEEAIVNLAFRHEVDVIILAESNTPPGVILKALNRKKTEFHFSPGDCKKIHIFTRFPRRFLKVEGENNRATVRRLKLPRQEEILLVAVHLLHRQNEFQRNQECVELSEMIRDAESRIGHTKTVLVGDLNMNPFEYGVVAAAGLNATMARSIALRRERSVDFRSYPFFYNPMWGLFGDTIKGRPCGTFYYGKKEPTYFWNMFDQVLIRPDLLPNFRNEDLEILIEDGINSFVSSSGLPDKSSASNHLPLLFKLNI